MGVVYTIGDPHIGHRHILKYRPMFSSIKEHDETIIENWNKVVKRKHDIVWVLGDFIIANKEYDFDAFLLRLNGIIRLVPGNHDDMRYFNTSKLLNKKFTIAHGVFKKYGFWFSHAPIHHLSLRGHMNVHGHVHSNSVPDDNYINVSADNVNYTPVSLEELRAIRGE